MFYIGLRNQTCLHSSKNLYLYYLHCNVPKYIIFPLLLFAFEFFSSHVFPLTFLLPPSPKFPTLLSWLNLNFVPLLSLPLTYPFLSSFCLHISYCYFPFLFSLPPLSLFLLKFSKSSPLIFTLISYFYLLCLIFLCFHPFIRVCAILFSKLKSFSKKISPNLFLFLVTSLFISSLPT